MPDSILAILAPVHHAAMQPMEAPMPLSRYDKGFLPFLLNFYVTDHNEYGEATPPELVAHIDGHIILPQHLVGCDLPASEYCANFSRQAGEAVEVIEHANKDCLRNKEGMPQEYIIDELVISESFKEYDMGAPFFNSLPYFVQELSGHRIDIIAGIPIPRHAEIFPNDITCEFYERYGFEEYQETGVMIRMFPETE